MNGAGSDPKAGPHRRDTGAGFGMGAIAFVAFVVVALAVVPIVLGRRVADDIAEINEVLEPAQTLGADLALIQARQMARFQAFLLTGDSTFQAPYVADLAQEDSIYSGLNGLVESMDLDVRERLAELASTASRWHVRHRGAFQSPEARESLMAELDVEQALYRELQSAGVSLEQAILDDVNEGRASAAATQDLEARITYGLVALALGAMVMLVLAGMRLNSVSQESDLRRRSAVRARRENDALLDATSEGVLGIDLDGACTSLNEAGSRLLGWREGEIRGRDVHEAIHHTRLDGTPRMASESPILAALRRGGRATSDGHDVLWRRDRTRFPARWVLQPMVDGRVVRGGVLTFTDMTAVRENEEALERAVRVRDEVVSIASHDLKNPLGVVAGASELLLELDLDQDERRVQIGLIRKSAERMQGLIGDLLDVSRIEAGALVVDRRERDPERLLTEVESTFRHQAEEHDVELCIEHGGDLPPLLCDERRVLQALSNLVGNALRFTPGGGTITVAARASADGGVALSVDDTGPGIPEDQQTHLFDRFWQANRTDRTGSGLGLSIVRGVVEAHGGSVDVESTPGDGTTFTLTFPPADEGAEAESEPTRK